MKESEDELSPREVEAFHELAREKTPPDFLEQRVVEALKGSHLINRSWFGFERSRPVMIGSGIAAMLALFALGVVIGAWWKSSPSTTGNLPEFMLVLRNPLPTDSADEELKRVKEYGAWARTLAQEGLVIDGEKLKDDARTLNVIDGRSVVMERPPDPKELAIAGYFLIRAGNYEQAIRIAENCPHAKYGGTIEIRQIDH